MGNKMNAAIVLFFSSANVGFVVAFPDSPTIWINAFAAVFCFGAAIIISMKH